MDKTQGERLVETFVPKELLRKPDFKGYNTLTAKQQFEKTTGNIYVELDPPEIKFDGYQLQKQYTTYLKVINKAPIPQRVFILPPENPAFAIKTNKKGALPSGMFETVQIAFHASEFKYQYDVIRINTETENFVVPLYAYPSITGIKQLFPKIIDFGSVQLRQTASNYYPIVNPVPLEFSYSFEYVKECNEIMITPLKGVVGSKETVNIEISFNPLTKKTSTAEVYFKIQQFDFEPILIKIMGNGKDKEKIENNKRIKSSKLTPLQQKEKTQDKGLGVSKGSGFKRSMTIRSNFPRLLAKKTIAAVENEEVNILEASQKEYLSKYSKTQELDKQKQIKFAQYLGQLPLNQQELQYERKIVEEFANARNEALKNMCLNRFLPQVSSAIQVQVGLIEKKEVCWNNARNDQLLLRRMALLRFMKAGSRVIVKYRLMKRLGKLKEFLKDCKSKSDVRKKVEESYLKSLETRSGLKIDSSGMFDFNLSSMLPSYFELQFAEETGPKTLTFKAEGKPQFDDLAQVEPMNPHSLELYKLGQVGVTGDSFQHSRHPPNMRISFEEEHALKTSSLPQYDALEPSSVYQQPLKIMGHHFIYADSGVRRYGNYSEIDEKDISYLFQEKEEVEDEFQGWTKGEREILKAKFMRNNGCDFTLFSSFNYSNTQNMDWRTLPLHLASPLKEDIPEDGDSDDEKYVGAEPENVMSFLARLEGAEVSGRREKGIQNSEKVMRGVIQTSLEEVKRKTVAEAIVQMRDLNRFAEKIDRQLMF